MTLTIFTQRDLLEIRRDMRLEQPSDWWRRTFFGGSPHFSQNKEIQFGKITGTRAMAPFAQPSHMGKPIVKERGAALESFMPGYIKLLDAVRPEDATTLTPEEILTGEQLDMQTRFDLRTAEVASQHMQAIYRTWDWMCARAVIDGAVTVKYEQDQGMPNPEVTVSFGRDANLTIGFGAGNDWSLPGADILGDLSDWLGLGRSAIFGGTYNRLIVGSDVAPLFTKNTGILDLLKTDVRGGDGTQFTRGLFMGADPDNPNAPSYIGTIAGNGVTLEVWTYSDHQLDNAGNKVEMLNPKDVVMLAPGVDGLMAYGAIYDVRTVGGNVRTDIFQKQYEEENPSQINMLTQSAPLPIVRYPNRTLKATVLP